MKTPETQRTHAERIAHAREQAVRVEKAQGKSDVQRNIYMKQRKVDYEKVKGSISQ